MFLETVEKDVSLPPGAHVCRRYKHYTPYGIFEVDGDEVYEIEHVSMDRNRVCIKRLAVASVPIPSAAVEYLTVRADNAEFMWRHDSEYTVVRRATRSH